ncbi:branched-subunit amino acid transport protein AzlD [Enterobacter sp. BIGb0383]|uniref:AzlD domain-containing protein n=1 Tax=unclassified Enterobacter TaxID=2608935 RepID=UPI000F463457|nr:MULTISPECIES: AzlD domain-containing protein [unclassified Enterobacter]ROP48976.1 branched-subunit amino acid transport protein AzlD [Enterobacter sp. BIGb0383]ROS00588.1 branched-subunit amino acid transport protein AzlD [Enterobacter sp. BIGb0359]
MASTTLIIGGIALLSVGTYLMRFGGAKLGNKLALSERAQALLSDAATTLLFAVALAATLYENASFAGMARVLGVAFALFLAWRKVPLILVILSAAVVTALLRLAGIK